MPIISVDPTGEEIYLPEGETVLAGLYAAGHAYTIGCRRGGCGVCKVDLLEGRVSYSRTVAAVAAIADKPPCRCSISAGQQGFPSWSGVVERRLGG